MKCFRILLPLFVFLSTLGLIGCNEGDKAEGTGREIVFTDSLPGGQYAVEVKGLQVEPGYLSLKLSWEPVISDELAYYEVEWDGKNATVPAYNIDNTVYTAQTKDTSYMIERLLNETYTVKVRAIAKNMMKSAPAVVDQITPDEDLVAPTGFKLTKAVELGRSVQFKWENPKDDDFDGVEILLKKETDADWTIRTRTNANEDGATVAGLEPLTKYLVQIRAYDRVGNFSEEEMVEGDVKTKKQVTLNTMKIFRFSSEEKKGEGDNGSAAFAVDGNVNTYWHSIWSSGNYWVKGKGLMANGGSNYGRMVAPDYQWLIIDLGQKVTPTRITVYPRKQSNTWGLITSFKLEASPYDLAVYDPDKYGVFPASHALGSYDISGSTLNHKPGVCDIENLVTNVRYVKVTFMSATNDNYARVGEIEIEAMVDEE